VRVTSQSYTIYTQWRSCALRTYIQCIVCCMVHLRAQREALWLPYPAFCPLKLETVCKVKGSPEKTLENSRSSYTWCYFVKYESKTWIAPSLSIQQFLLGRGSRHSLIIPVRKNDHYIIKDEWWRGRTFSEACDCLLLASGADKDRKLLIETWSTCELRFALY
jgi:hypothetical protein